MQANDELFFMDELKEHVPLISPGDVKGSRCLASDRLTTSYVNIICCNASACSYNTLVIWHPLSISMTLGDGTDWTKDGLGGQDITAVHRDPGEGGDAS